MRKLVFCALVVLIHALGMPNAVVARADPVRAVQALLDRQMQALESGNRADYMATIDPQASDEFKTARGKSFDGMRSVPFVDLDLRVRTDDSGDLAPGLDLASKHHASDAYMPETRRTYRLEGYEDRPSVNSLYTTYVERDGKWYVAADDDSALIGLDSDREIWDVAAMTVQRTDHFLILTSPDQTARGAALGEIAEDAHAVFRSRWSRPWFDRMPLIVPPSAEAAKAVLHTTADIDNFSAFTVYVPYRDATGWHVTAPRLYAQEANLAGVSRGLQVQTMVHELVHAASASLSGPFSPVWQQEGLAEWIRLYKPKHIALPTGIVTELPADEDFTTGNATKLRQAYTLSTSATSYLSRVFGDNAPVDLLVALGTRRTVAGSSSYNLDAAFREVTGKSVDDFTKSWSSSPSSSS